MKKFKILLALVSLNLLISGQNCSDLRVYLHNQNPQIIANKPFILKPGADHLMFFGMGKSILNGKDIPLKFIFLDKQKLIEKTITFSVI